MADKITQNDDGSLNVSDNPIIPFIEGDGTGVDIWPAAQLVLDAAAAKHGKHDRVERGARRREGVQRDRRLAPRRDRRQSFREYLIGIKGPLTTPDRRRLPQPQRRAAPDPRPVRVPAAGPLVPGVPSPVKHPELVDMVIFRENTEDIYAGLEVEAGTPEAKKLTDFAARASSAGTIRADSGIGIKPISRDRLEAPDPRRPPLRGQAAVARA